MSTSTSCAESEEVGLDKREFAMDLRDSQQHSAPTSSSANDEETPVVPERSSHRPRPPNVVVDLTALDTSRRESKTGYTPTSAQTYAISPIMLVAEQVPISVNDAYGQTLLIRGRNSQSSGAITESLSEYNHKHSESNIASVGHHDDFSGPVARRLTSPSTTVVDVPQHSPTHTSVLPLPLNFPTPPSTNRGEKSSASSLVSQGTQTSTEPAMLEQSQRHDNEIRKLRRQNQLLEATLETLLAFLRAGDFTDGTIDIDRGPGRTHHRTADSGFGTYSGDMTPLEMYLGMMAN